MSKPSGAVDKHGIMGQYEKLHNILLYNHAALGIDWGDVRTLLVLMAHKWTASSEVFPSHAALAKKMGVSKTSITRSIARLVAAHLIEFDDKDSPGGRSRRCYTFNGLRDRLNEYVTDPDKLSADFDAAVGVNRAEGQARAARLVAGSARASTEKEAKGGAFGLDAPELAETAPVRFAVVR